MTTIAVAPVPARGRRRGPAILWSVVVALLIVVSVFVATRPTSNQIPFDPDNPGPAGGQAMARVLADHGVDVNPMRRLDDLLSADSDAQTTVVVTNPYRIGPEGVRKVLDHFSSAHRVVLLDVDPADIEDRVRPGTDQAQGCTIDWLSGLTSAPRPGDQLYGPRESGQRICLARANGYAALALDDRVLLLGATGAVANDSVLEADNAAIGLRALGGSDRLLWLSTDVGGVQDDTGSGGLPWPAWWGPTVLVLFGATVALMIWRGRRLGRLVHEPLPVVVPAQETTTARGRLYRKAKDTDRAARVLRAATRDRLAAYLGSPDPVRATARHLGRPEQEIAALLLDAPVAGERELVTLANELSTLERQVHPQ